MDWDTAVFGDYYWRTKKRMKNKIKLIMCAMVLAISLTGCNSVSYTHLNCFFGEAYNVSYTDVYDFASAGNKKSLKKLEIEMGIHHQELGLPWDQPDVYKRQVLSLVSILSTKYWRMHTPVI